MLTDRVLLEGLALAHVVVVSGVILSAVALVVVTAWLVNVAAFRWRVLRQRAERMERAVTMMGGSVNEVGALMNDAEEALRERRARWRQREEGPS